MTTPLPKRLAVLTSGGDAPGMNAALRAVVRSALDQGMQVFAINEGYQGMVDGGDRIRTLSWDSVGGIMHRGGTVIGTARCPAFRSRDGRLRAASNLLEHEIDCLVVIGGDGSLTGAALFRQEWPGLLAELVSHGTISQDLADRHPSLTIVGLVGSIDNDMAGTDMTIGADTALHRITAAIDAISSTAASHQRIFVVEVMGRNCGYLALMGALAAGADWVLIPESPPDVDDWETAMCRVLKAGRQAGRRDSIVIVAEGARDRHGTPIGSEYVRQVLEKQLGEEVRMTILGHVQRGGAPSAFDRCMSTLLGHAAVAQIATAGPDSEPMLIGMQNNRIAHAPLMRCVDQTREIADTIAAHDYERAMELRGGSFREAFQTLRTLTRALPHPRDSHQPALRLAVLNAGAPAPGMNTAVRAAVRLGLDQGHTLLGVRNGFQGLVDGDIDELDWMSVSGWASMGGAELGVSRKLPSGPDLYAIARTIERQQIQALLVVGGWAGYQAAERLYRERENFPTFQLPIICLPAAINNNLPGTDLSIGADTALNNIVAVVDKIKQSAVATQRCFIVEVMGRSCGYLALMSGLASGAERVYLPEERVTLRDLEADLVHLVEGFRRGKRLGLLIRNEQASRIYTSAFMCALFEEEGGDLFEVRQAILGHLQQGGDPTAFDRILATRLAAHAITLLLDQAGRAAPACGFIGLCGGRMQFSSMEDLPRMVDEAHQRPREQWWMELRPIAHILAQSAPGSSPDERLEIGD